MTSNNVIAFPKKIEGNPKVSNIEEINQNLQQMRMYHIQEAILQLAPIIFNQLDVAGFGISEDDEGEDIKDGALIIESIRSYMCKYYGVFHPFQVVAEAIFSPKEDEEDGAFKIADKLDLDLKNPEEE